MTNKGSETLKTERLCCLQTGAPPPEIFSTFIHSNFSPGYFKLKEASQCLNSGFRIKSKKINLYFLLSSYLFCFLILSLSLSGTKQKEQSVTNQRKCNVFVVAKIKFVRIKLKCYFSSPIPSNFSNQTHILFYNQRMFLAPERIAA